MSEKNRLLASQFVVEEDVVEARGALRLEPLQLLAPFLQPSRQLVSFLSSAPESSLQFVHGRRLQEYSEGRHVERARAELQN